MKVLWNVKSFVFYLSCVFNDFECFRSFQKHYGNASLATQNFHHQMPCPMQVLMDLERIKLTGKKNFSLNHITNEQWNKNSNLYCEVEKTRVSVIESVAAVIDISFSRFHSFAWWCCLLSLNWFSPQRHIYHNKSRRDYGEGVEDDSDYNWWHLAMKSFDEDCGSCQLFFNSSSIPSSRWET
jgi:hypothetical protein